MTDPAVPVPMTRKRAAALIYLIQTLEPGYLRTTSTEAADAQVTVWRDMLEPVDAAWAKRSIETYYAKGHTRLTVGMLRTEWDRRRDEYQRLAEARRPVIDESLLRGAPAWVRPLMAALADHPGMTDPETHEWVEQWCRDHGHPMPVWDDTPADIRERNCGVQGCRCNHRSCRGGWLDDEDQAVKHGRRYPQAQRCPACEQAVLERGAKK